MRLWDWASAAYAAPGVEVACLALQDEHGQCVSYLLWAAWAGKSGRFPTDDRLRDSATMARDWNGALLAPLRAVRRVSRQDWPGISDSDRQGLRERVKESELAAERILLEALEALTPGAGEAPSTIEGLGAAAACWGRPASEPALAMLARALEPVPL